MGQNNSSFLWWAYELHLHHCEKSCPHNHELTQQTNKELVKRQGQRIVRHTSLKPQPEHFKKRQNGKVEETDVWFILPSADKY